MKSDNSINQIKKIHLANDELVIDWQDGSQSNLYSHWLRDHCQMPQSRNANNGQRLFSVINIPKNTSIEEVKQDEVPKPEEEKKDEKEEAEVVSGEAYEHDGIRLSTLKSVPNHFSLVSKENIT
jgi:hypothetical protein